MPEKLKRTAEFFDAQLFKEFLLKRYAHLVERSLLLVWSNALPYPISSLSLSEARRLPARSHVADWWPFHRSVQKRQCD